MASSKPGAKPRPRIYAGARRDLLLDGFRFAVVLDGSPDVISAHRFREGAEAAARPGHVVVDLLESPPRAPNRP